MLSADQQGALSASFLAVFLGTALGALALAVLEIGIRGEHWVLHLVGGLLYRVTVSITGSLNVPANNRLAGVPASDEVAASRGWADFTWAWRPANHLRSLTAITGAALLAWP